jgi:hypothetical protein
MLTMSGSNTSLRSANSGKAPGRFKFTLKHDHEFNYSIIVDIFYLEDGPVLHVVDSATAFNALEGSVSTYDMGNIAYMLD